MGRIHLHQAMAWSFPKKSGKKISPDHGSTDDGAKVQGSCWHEELSEGTVDNDQIVNDQINVLPSRSKRTSGHRFFLPVHYTPSYRYPLLVWFHHNGFNENQIDSVMPHISVRNYVGIGIRGNRSADTQGHRFDWHDSPASIAAAQESIYEAVDEAFRRFNIHPSRIVLAGYRDGGTMAQRIALRNPKRIAGVVSLGGRIPQEGLRNYCELRQRRFPMLWQWGQENQLYTQENLKTDCRLAMTIGADVEIRQYPGEDEMATAVLRDVDDWLMRRIIGGSTVTDSRQWETSPISYSEN